MPRLLALVAMVVLSLPALAQSRVPGAPAPETGGADWREFGITGGERGAGAACALGACGATYMRAGALRTTILEGGAVRPNLIHEGRSGGLVARDARPSPVQEWRQHLGIRDGEEDYNCILSLGIGGELKSGGYVGTQLLGRARTWNRPGGKDAR
jgi:hypothetical protein